MKTGQKFSDAFKKDAVLQVVDRGYAVKEVAALLGIITKSLYTWKAVFSKPAKVRREDDLMAGELRRVKA
jgi:transposase